MNTYSFICIIGSLRINTMDKLVRRSILNGINLYLLPGTHPNNIVIPFNDKIIGSIIGVVPLQPGPISRSSYQSSLSREIYSLEEYTMILLTVRLRYGRTRVFVRTRGCNVGA